MYLKKLKKLDISKTIYRSSGWSNIVCHISWYASRIVVFVVSGIGSLFCFNNLFMYSIFSSILFWKLASSGRLEGQGNLIDRRCLISVLQLFLQFKIYRKIINFPTFFQTKQDRKAPCFWSLLSNLSIHEYRTKRRQGRLGSKASTFYHCGPKPLSIKLQYQCKLIWVFGIHMKRKKEANTLTIQHFIATGRMYLPCIS